MTNVTSSGEIKMSSPVSRVLSGTVIHLGPASPQASSDLPESSAGRAIGFLFGLAPGGVYHRRELLPVTRCALTAPFHPYHRGGIGRPTRRNGGLFSVALSVGLPRPGVTRHRFFWESGLSSTLLPRPRPSSLPRAARLAPNFSWGQSVSPAAMPSARIFTIWKRVWC